MSDYREAFVGIDVAKLRNATAIAESARRRHELSLGQFPYDEPNICSLDCSFGIGKLCVESRAGRDGSMN